MRSEKIQKENKRLAITGLNIFFWEKGKQPRVIYHMCLLKDHKEGLNTKIKMLCKMI